MATDHLSIRFYLNTYKAKEGKAPVYARIIVNRKKVELATDFQLTANEWNDAKQRAKKDLKVNDGLIDLERRIHDIVYTLRNEQKPISANAIKLHLVNKAEIDTTLLSYFDTYLHKITQSGELQHNTIFRYKDTFDHLKSFLQTIKATGLLVKEANYKLVSDFDFYLLNQPTKRDAGRMTRNTANKHHTRLKTIFIHAHKEGLLTALPYTGFKLKYTPSKRTFLTRVELNRIIEYNFSHNRTLEKVKDIFLFSVYTGLRFIDAQKLGINQIIKEKKGRQYKYHLDLIIHKTGEQQAIPLLQPAVDIISKYDNHEREITGKVLPQISNQKINLYLKEIANLTGIDKELTHHVARHTCATTILISGGFPIEAVGKWLGHRSLKSTQVYAKITKEYLELLADTLTAN